MPPINGSSEAGTWTGPSIGTSEAALTSCLMGFSLQVTEYFVSVEAYIKITSIGLLVSYTVSSGTLGGDTVDAVATSARGTANITSSVAQGLPGYLLAISLYPGGSAAPVSDQPLWRAVTPVNFAGASPTAFQMQERVIHSPGPFSAAGAGGTPASI